MKRANEINDGGRENLGLKKVKFSNGNDESSAAIDRNESEKESVPVENGALDFAGVDNNGDHFGDVVPDNHDGPTFGCLEESNRWDFDINFDSIFGNEEEQQGLIFDLNHPVCRSQDVGMEEGRLGYAQGAMINENKVEIIDIPSDESDKEVEIIGCTYGYNTNDKQIEVGMPYDRTENLSLGLGIVGTEDSVVGERRYTREEKGKNSVNEDSLIDPWLSLKANSPIDLDFQSDGDESSTRFNEPAEDVEVRTWQPAVPAASSELDERELRQAEQALIIRERLTREARRDTAKRLARTKFSDQNNRSQPSQPSSEKQQPPTSGPAELIGNCPGPFSDALKRVRERTLKRSAQQLIQWKSSEENQGRSITAVFVPSLLELSLKALAESAEGIVSLELVPDNLLGRLTNILCDMNKMNGHIMSLLVEGCPTEVRIKNCSWLTEEQFQQTFWKCQKNYLRVLQLDLCGQCMLDFAFRNILAQSSNGFSRLAILSLRGACRLSDSGLKDLVMSAPALRSINLGQCNLLTSNSINFIADSLGSNLRELYIDDCHKINAMLILPAFRKFTYLEVLSVAGIFTITDQFVSEMITVCSRSIKELDLANCLQLTDCSLKTIGINCADLSSLNISNLHNLTDLGIQYLANGCKSIQKLKFCRNEFSDEAVAAFLESSGEYLTELLLNNMANVGPNTAFSLAKRSRKLLSLDISWCRKISSEALGLIVDSCSSLKLLKVFGCRQITNVFLNGHSNRLVRIIGLNLTPILDHLYLLEPEEVLLRYSPLPICMED